MMAQHYWCNHPDCLESLDSFSTPAQVQAHQREEHGGCPGASPEPPPQLPPSCIILDLDGTLVDDLKPPANPGSARLECSAHPDLDGDLCYLRPHAAEFVEWCLDHVDHVGIWTAASPGWAQFVLATLQIPAARFAFVWSGDKTNRPIRKSDETTSCGMYPSYDECGRLRRKTIKRLKKIYNCPHLGAAGLGICRHRTLIVDNTPEVYSENYGNGVPVPTFDAGSAHAVNDVALIELVPYLEDWLCVGRCKPTDSSGQIDVTRGVEKRFWHLEQHERPFAAGVASMSPSLGAEGETSSNDVQARELRFIIAPGNGGCGPG